MENRSLKRGRTSGEIRGVPDKEVYNREYGAPYRMVRWACIPGIAYYILGIILFRAGGIVIPGAGNAITGWIVSAWATASFAGIPISFWIAHISFKKLKNDYLVFRDRTFMWHKDVLREKLSENEMITKCEEYTVLELSNKSEETKGYFKIRGVIEKVEIRNGKRLKPLKVGRITIPRAFTNLSEIYKYPFIEDIMVAKDRENKRHLKANGNNGQRKTTDDIGKAIQESIDV